MARTFSCKRRSRRVWRIRYRVEWRKSRDESERAMRPGEATNGCRARVAVGDLTAPDTRARSASIDFKEPYVSKNTRDAERKVAAL